MDSETPNVCSQCGAPGAKKCSGCHGAPTYPESVAEPKVYCSIACQAANWEDHNVECNALKTRNMMARAAVLLKAIICRVRMNATAFDAESVNRIEGSNIFVNMGNSNESRHLLNPFRFQWDGDKAVGEAVLLYYAGVEAMIYLRSFTHGLLANLSTAIEEVAVIVKQPKLQVTMVSAGVDRMDTLEYPLHNVYKVTLKNGGVWAVDPAGASYGFTETLYPWSEYCENRTARLLEHFPLGYARIWESPRIPLIQLEMKRKLAETLEKSIPAMAQIRGGMFRDLLKGADAAFEEATGQVLGFVEEVVTESIVQLRKEDERVARQWLGDNFSEIEERMESYLEAFREWEQSHPAE